MRLCAYLSILGLIGHIAQASPSTGDPCSTLAVSHYPHASIISATKVPVNTTLNVASGQEVCGSPTMQSPGIEVCRVQVNITTSSQSSTLAEVWLPAEESRWNGRLAATGNGALNGCIDYQNVAYLAGRGFAACGDNGGHHGYSGEAFFNNKEVIIDFAHRARHSTVELSKAVVHSFYKKSHTYSYYYGCSTGGRQGFKSAQTYPTDFDGIIAGAPAFDFNHLVDWSGHFYGITGPNATDPRFLTATQWAVVSAAILRQCDARLDGVADGIIEDTSKCDFNPKSLLCSRKNKDRSKCLTPLQIQTVRKIYSPLVTPKGKLLYPRFVPSAESSEVQFGYLTGSLATPATDWFRYAIYNDPEWDPATLDYHDMAYADTLDEIHGNVSSFDGDLSAFRQSGGKLITYHGMSDAIISPENSMRYYDKVARTMRASHSELDEFYRFFRISGMGHCIGGPGAGNFGQGAPAPGASDDILEDIIAWVEKGVAPERLTGAKYVNDTPAEGVAWQRAHCRYPYLTTYKGVGDPYAVDSWKCKLLPGW
ncbi:tannase and feruloyl esterase family protein [Aspergillus heterothallicus]